MASDTLTRMTRKQKIHTKQSTGATDVATPQPNKSMMSLNEYKQATMYNPCIPFVWIFLDRLGKLEKKYRLTCPQRAKKLIKTPNESN
jgi:hypothetical protein